MEFGAMVRRCVRFCAFAIGLAALSAPAAQAATGLLMVSFDSVFLSSSNGGYDYRPSNGGSGLSGVTLEEVKTKKTVGFRFPRRVEVLELEEGLYCVDYISLSVNSFNFCESPLIRVTADHVTNAGLWRFGIEPNLSTARRVVAFGYPEEIEKLAAKDFPELLGKYRNKDEHRLDFTAKPPDQWTDDDRRTMRGFYVGLPKDDSPPVPLQGIAPVVAAVRGFARPGEALISKFHVTVNHEGQVVATEVLQTNSPEATKAGIDAAKSLKFAPGMCGGNPCRMEFPIYLVFR